MPKRTDLQSILIIGSGPIIIGQACEFDYSGTQACKALREEGYRVILVNSNPATIMTDPEMADATYIEPITPEAVAKIIEKERPDAILPTLGGQTGLNTGLALAEDGTLEKFGVEMIGANAEVINRAEDREEFAQCIEELGLGMARSEMATSWEEALAVKERIGLPCMIRPVSPWVGPVVVSSPQKKSLKRLPNAACACHASMKSPLKKAWLGGKNTNSR